MGGGASLDTAGGEPGPADRVPTRAAEPQRGVTPLPLHARMLLGLQAMAGNAAVADLVEARKPTQTTPPPLVEDGVVDEAAPAAVVAEAPPGEEAAVPPRAGETDDELAALDAEADGSTSISPPPVGEDGMGDGQPADLPEAQGGTDPG